MSQPPVELLVLLLPTCTSYIVSQTRALVLQGKGRLNGVKGVPVLSYRYLYYTPDQYIPNCKVLEKLVDSITAIT